MTCVLALSTSGQRCSVCLDVDGNRFETTQHVERRHNELLLPMVNDLLEQHGISRRALTAVAFDAGPGSFTGVRIAAAAAQAIALASDIPVVRVRASAALTLAACAAHPQAQVVVCSIRSRGDLYYLSAHTRNADVMLREDALFELMPAAGWWSDLDSETMVGAGVMPGWWDARIRFDETVQLTAAHVATLAVRKLEAGLDEADAQALPIYVRGDSPWRRAGRNPD